MARTPSRVIIADLTAFVVAASFLAWCLSHLGGCTTPTRTVQPIGHTTLPVRDGVHEVWQWWPDNTVTRITYEVRP